MATAATSIMGSGAPVRAMPMKASVCRSLFGRPTPEERAATEATTQSILNRIVDEKSQKYGFNFRQGTPIVGNMRWEWTRVQSPTSYYQPKRQDDNVTPAIKPVASEPKLEDRVGQAVNDDAVSTSPAEPTVAVDEPSTSTASTSPPVIGNRKRSSPKTMKDYFPVKKSRSSVSSFHVKDSSHNNNSSSSSSSYDSS